MEFSLQYDAKRFSSEVQTVNIIIQLWVSQFLAGYIPMIPSYASLKYGGDRRCEATRKHASFPQFRQQIKYSLHSASQSFQVQWI
jgi:hypothetical protein